MGLTLPPLSLEPSPHCTPILPGTGCRVITVEDDSETHILRTPILSISVVDEMMLRVFDSGTGIHRYQVNNYAEYNPHMEAVQQPEVRDEDSFFGSFRWLPLGVGHNHECMINDGGAKSCVSSVSGST
jgi:hypothetical protein